MSEPVEPLVQTVLQRDSPKVPRAASAVVGVAAPPAIWCPWCSLVCKSHAICMMVCLLMMFQRLPIRLQGTSGSWLEPCSLLVCAWKTFQRLLPRADLWI